MAKKVKVPSLKEMQKKFPGFVIASENDDTHLPWLPSRFHAFNYVLGGGRIFYFNCFAVNSISLYFYCKVLIIRYLCI